MNDESSDSSHRSWLERLGLALQGEPKNKEELVEVLRDAAGRGLLDSDSLTMMEGVMEVSEMRVRDVMLPRPQMMVIQQDWPIERIMAQALDSGHSRFPVIDDDRDDVIGILLVKDLLRVFAEGDPKNFPLRDILRPAKFIPESKRLNTLLKEFRSSRLHMAIVVDEYGGVAGLVTIEDVLEQIVGEIDDEHDEEEEDFIRPQSNNRYVVKALTAIEDFNEYFHTDFDDEKVDTVGGLVTMTLGYLPQRGETVQVGEFRFRVLRADNRRLHLLEVSRVAETPTPPSDQD